MLLPINFHHRRGGARGGKKSGTLQFTLFGTLPRLGRRENGRKYNKKICSIARLPPSPFSFPLCSLVGRATVLSSPSRPGEAPTVAENPAAVADDQWAKIRLQPAYSPAFGSHKRGDATEHSHTHTHALAFYFSLPFLSFFLFSEAVALVSDSPSTFRKEVLRQDRQYPKIYQ